MWFESFRWSITCQNAKRFCPCFKCHVNYPHAQVHARVLYCIRYISRSSERFVNMTLSIPPLNASCCPITATPNTLTHMLYWPITAPGVSPPLHHPHLHFIAISHISLWNVSDTLDNIDVSVCRTLWLSIYSDFILH